MLGFHQLRNYQEAAERPGTAFTIQPLTPALLGSAFVSFKLHWALFKLETWGLFFLHFLLEQFKLLHLIEIRLYSGADMTKDVLS